MFLDFFESIHFSGQSSYSKDKFTWSIFSQLIISQRYFPKINKWRVMNFSVKKLDVITILSCFKNSSIRTMFFLSFPEKHTSVNIVVILRQRFLFLFCYKEDNVVCARRSNNAFRQCVKTRIPPKFCKEWALIGLTKFEIVEAYAHVVVSML